MSINETQHFLGKNTIAEDVEDDEILEIPREIGMDFVQGYGTGVKTLILNFLVKQAITSPVPMPSRWLWQGGRSDCFDEVGYHVADLICFIVTENERRQQSDN